jgi:hypothetical protein
MDETARQASFLDRLVDASDLANLESQLNQFNIFEAVGMVKQEIRHSRFLAFLLDPAQSHQLGDTFLKTFLQQVFTTANVTPPNVDDIRTTSLIDTKVHWEWNYIDILILCPACKLVCAIENKVDSGEHSNQLQRYWQVVQAHFSDYHKYFVFLTPTGMPPQGKSDQQDWLPYSYSEIANQVDSFVESSACQIDPEVSILMQHYSSLIRRHLMEESDIAQLCRQIYYRHQDALDLVFKHRPNREGDIFDQIKILLDNTPDQKVVIDHVWPKFKSRKGESIPTFGFAIPLWDHLKFQLTCNDWTPSRRILIFEFTILPGKIGLKLTLGPGSISIRSAISNALKDYEHEIEGLTHDSLDDDWVDLLRRSAVSNVALDTPIETIAEELKNFWGAFLSNDLPKIDAAIKSVEVYDS